MTPAKARTESDQSGVLRANHLTTTLPNISLNCKKIMARKKQIQETVHQSFYRYVKSFQGPLSV